MTIYSLTTCDIKIIFKHIAEIKSLQNDLLFIVKDKSKINDFLIKLQNFIFLLTNEASSQGLESDFSCIFCYIDKIEANILFNSKAYDLVYIKGINSVLLNWLTEYKCMFPKYKYSKEKFKMQLLPNFYEYNEESILKNIQLNITFPFATSYNKYSYDIYACVIKWIQNIQISSRCIYLDTPNHLYDFLIDEILCLQDLTPYLDYPTVEFIYKGKKVNIDINNLSIYCKVDNPLIKLKYKDNPIYISEKCLLDKKFFNLPPSMLLHLTIEVYGDLKFSTSKY